MLSNVFRPLSPTLSPHGAEREKLNPSLVRMKATFGDVAAYLAASHSGRWPTLGGRCGTWIGSTNDVLSSPAGTS